MGGGGLNSGIEYFLFRQARKLKSAKKWGGSYSPP